MPASRVTRFHFSMSACITAANSSGLLPTALEALLRQQLLHLGRLQRIDNDLVELVDDRPRRARRRQHAVPADDFVAGQSRFRDGRNFGCDGEPLGGADAERAHRAGLDLRQRRDRRVEERCDLTCHHRLLRLRHAAVGHMRYLHAGGGEEQLHRQVGQAADADGGVVELPLARQFDELLDRLRRRRVRHQQDFADLRHHRNRREVLFAVVGQFGIERRIGGVARKHHQQRVAVGFGLRDRAGSDGAAGAGAVVDDDGLTELLADVLADQPRQNVGDASGAGRHDHLDGARRIVLRVRRWATLPARERQRGMRGIALKCSSVGLQPCIFFLSGRIPDLCSQ